MNSLVFSGQLQSDFKCLFISNLCTNNISRCPTTGIHSWYILPMPKNLPIISLDSLECPLTLCPEGKIGLQAHILSCTPMTTYFIQNVNISQGHMSIRLLKTTQQWGRESLKLLSIILLFSLLEHYFCTVDILVTVVNRWWH